MFVLTINGLLFEMYSGRLDILSTSRATLAITAGGGMVSVRQYQGKNALGTYIVQRREYTYSTSVTTGPKHGS